MSTNDKTTLTNFLTGGDLFFHRLRLLLSNGLRLFGVGCAVFSVTFFILVQVFVTKYEWHVFWKSSLASFWTIFGRPNLHLNFTRPDGKKVDGVTSAAILKFVRDTPELALDVAKVAGFGAIALGLSVAAVIAMAVYYIKYGKDAQADDFKRGQKLVDQGELVAMITKPSPIKIGKVHIPLNLLARNILVSGSMGSGKTVGIDQMIEDARKWGKKMVIYDKTGEFTEKFFRPGIDVILSPVDARCADWSIYADLRKITDPAMVSSFFVPENKKSSDPIWDNAARMLLEDLIVIVRNRDGSMSDLKDIITQSSLMDLSKLLKDNGAPSSGTINTENAKGSESIRMTLISSPAIRFFSFFAQTKAAFSVREFVRRDDDACLFLVSSTEHHEVAKPFISAWLELALSSAMSMKPTTDIRLMFFIDELASLPKLKVLDIALTEARKFGICTTIGIQGWSSMDEIYGEDMTKVYIANLQNKFILRCEEESSANRLADTLGKKEVGEKSESKSFGVESSRDGVSLSDKRTEIHLVTPSEVMVIPDLTGYLKLAGNFPIAKIEIRYKHRAKNVESYVERAGMDLLAPITVEACRAALVAALTTPASVPDDDVSEADAELELADPVHHSAKVADVSSNDLPVSLDEINHVPAAESEGHGFY